MKYTNKLAAFAIALLGGSGMLALTGCEGADIYSADSPDWLSAKIDSIAKSKGSSNADVYTVGQTDFSSGWWVDFSSYYVIPDGAKWTETFTLHINPSAAYAYKNFALLITNDVDRSGTGYAEYGAIRFDTDLTQARNSEWGTYIDRSCIDCDLNITDDADVASLQKLGGDVTLTVDRSPEDKFLVTITNGTVTKTYTQPTALTNLNSDVNNENIRCFLCVEGSYIDMKTCDIEQIRTTKTPDQQPVSMTFNNVPNRIIAGSDPEVALANLTATVTYDADGVRTVPASSLTYVNQPDFSVAGTYTLYFAYNKTFKDAAADNIITGYITVNVVEPASWTMVGNEDNSTAWWTAFGPDVKVNKGETVVSKFKNYTKGTANYLNYLVILRNSKLVEDAVLRADNFGWGTGYATCTAETSATDWATWLAAMDGADVTLYITNNGTTADIYAEAVGNDSITYTQSYKGITIANGDDLYYALTVEGGHLEFSDIYGNEDNTSGWWSAQSPNFKVASGTTTTTQFINYTSGAANWNNFVIDVCAQSTKPEYAVVRADNYGWGDGYGTCTTSGGQADWATWLAAMDGAKVTVSVTNHGDGTADVDITMIGTDGVTYTQYYHGITVDSNDCYFNMNVDGCHYIFEPFARNSASAAAKRASRGSAFMGKVIRKRY